MSLQDRSRFWVALFTIALVACRSEQAVLPLCDIADVAPDSAPLAVGDTLRFTASFNASASCTPPSATPSLIWTSTDPAVARVDSASGTVVGVASGVADIRARAVWRQQLAASAHVVVFAPLYDRIIVTRFRITCSDPNCLVWSVNGPLGIWTVALDGSDARLVRDGLQYPDHARVSPDGRVIVYDNSGPLYLVDGAGLTVRLLDTSLPNSYEPSWSPDGRWIIFAGFEPSSATRQIFVIRPDGTGLRQLSHDPLGATNPAWSPDGKTIAYQGASSSYMDGRAMLMDSSGANARLLCNGHGRAPQWSPDGGAVVLWDPVPWYLTRCSVATSRYDTLGVYQGNRPASWSPDGTRIIAGGGEIVWLDPARWVSYRGMSVLLPLGPDSLFNMSPFHTPSSPAGRLH